MTTTLKLEVIYMNDFELFFILSFHGFECT
jgi:hypothetical protein